MKIDIYEDTICPWCRIGKKYLLDALEQWQGEHVTLRWHAFLLDETTPQEGHNFQEVMTRKMGGPDRMQEAFGHVKQAGAAVGLEFNFDKIQFTPNTMLSHQLIALTPDEQKSAMIEAIMKAYFEDGANIGDIDVLVSTAGHKGMDKELAKQRLLNKEAVDLVETDLENARQLGIRGVPYFVINDKYALSGAYPPTSILQALQRVADET